MFPGSLIEGRFEVERQTGAGGMGLVFRAIDRLDGTKVAVKLLRGTDPLEIERFEREAAVLADLRHPGIVRYVAQGMTRAGERYLVMEWLEGEDLEHRLAQGQLAPADILTLLRKTSNALAIAHARGVVHRDIKPSNLYLVEKDVARVKLLDFGIARVADEPIRLTQSGVVIGTPSYMSPEQAQGESAIDARTDVFSLGCVLFECVVGRPPFEGVHAMAVLVKVLLQEVPSLGKLRADVPKPLERLVARMLAKAPKERPRDAGEVAEELEALSDLGGEWAPDRRASSLPAVGPSSSPQAPISHGALTLSEQRIVSVVLAGAPGREGGTLAKVVAAPEVERYGGRLDILANGSMLVTIWGAGSAVDRAERAIRCALSLQARFAEVPVCVVTGRGVVSARVIEGEVIDRGVFALRAARSGAIRLDGVTVGMLGARFVTEPEGDAFVLRGERVPGDTTPLFLGKTTPCVGRSRELATLEGVFSGCAEEPVASAVLVTGPAGAGKSRLRWEFVEKLRLRQVEILSGRADSLGEGSPFGPIADAIRGAAGIQEGEPIEARRQKLTQRLGRHLEGAPLGRVTAFLGELTRAPFPDDDDRALKAARGNPILMSDGMQSAWEDWISAECAAGPVVLLLDDLQWADAATVRLIDATLRNLRELPLMVLALARPEVHARFPGLWAERDVQTVRLGPLARRASEQLVRDALDKRAPDALVNRIVERADGNPFYLEELVRAVAAGRGDVLPDSVLGTVEARLDAEGSEAKRVLRAASVFGDRFSRKGVAALLGGDEHLEEAGARLEILAGRELIAPARAPGLADDAAYTFRHALVREAAYAALTETDRALGHLLAGAWLERMGHTDAMAIAEHFRRGGEPARSVRWYRRAAEQALEANDLAAASDRAERGVAGGAAGEDLGALRLVEAEAHAWRGDLALAEQRGLDAASLLAPGSAAWFRAVTQIVIAAGKQGGFERVEAWVGPINGAAPLGDAAGAQSICLSECATQLIFGGRYATADMLIDAAAGVQATAALEQTRAIRALVAGDLGAGLVGFNAALAAFEQASDRRNAAATLVNLGFAFAELGDFKRAEDSLRAAVVAAYRIGLHDVVLAAQHNLGPVLACCGHLEEARRLEQQAVEAFHGQGDPRLEGLARAYLAKIHVLAGDLVAAEREARAAAGALLATPPLRAGAVAVLARALLGQRRAEEALSFASEAFALLESLGTIEEGESLVRLIYAEALAANGLEPEFALAITSARDHLIAKAAKISDPTWRKRFLAGVPDNARTLLLAAGAPRAPGGGAGG